MKSYNWMLVQSNSKKGIMSRKFLNRVILVLVNAGIFSVYKVKSSKTFPADRGLRQEKKQAFACYSTAVPKPSPLIGG